MKIPSRVRFDISERAEPPEDLDTYAERAMLLATDQTGIPVSACGTRPGHEVSQG